MALGQIIASAEDLVAQRPRRVLGLIGAAPLQLWNEELDDVLKAAMQAGRVTQFSFERRRLSEVFRESLV